MHGKYENDCVSVSARARIEKVMDHSVKMGVYGTLLWCFVCKCDTKLQQAHNARNKQQGIGRGELQRCSIRKRPSLIIMPETIKQQ